jgi:hypothetical protein
MMVGHPPGGGGVGVGAGMSVGQPLRGRGGQAWGEGAPGGGGQA